MFFDVGCERDEVVIDGTRDLMIRVGLGFQPSTCASSGRRGKVDQERFVLCLCLFQGRISVFNPVDEHSSLLWRVGFERQLVKGCGLIIAPCCAHFKSELWVPTMFGDTSCPPQRLGFRHLHLIEGLHEEIDIQ